MTNASRIMHVKRVNACYCAVHDTAQEKARSSAGTSARMRSVHQNRLQRPPRKDRLAIQAQLNEVQALRQRYFDATVNEASFARENALKQYPLARIPILQGDILSPARQPARLICQLRMRVVLAQPVVHYRPYFARRMTSHDQVIMTIILAVAMGLAKHLVSGTETRRHIGRTLDVCRAGHGKHRERVAFFL